MAPSTPAVIEGFHGHVIDHSDETTGHSATPVDGTQTKDNCSLLGPRWYSRAPIAPPSPTTSWACPLYPQ